jgi:hypothetical protein
MKVSELARELRPYLIQIIREIVGDMKYDTATKAGDMTWIQGTPFPTDDASGKRDTITGVDLQLTGDDSSVNKGVFSSILGGSYNEIESGTAYSSIIGGLENYIESNYAGAMGMGALADNYFQFAIGSYLLVQGDAQSSIFAYNSSITSISSSWQDIAEFDMRADTTWVFRALVVGIRQGAGESFGYEVTGIIENDGGTTTLLGSTVTTLYEDDVSYGCQAVASDSNDSLVIQIIDTDNSGNASHWQTTLITAEVSWAA